MRQIHETSAGRQPPANSEKESKSKFHAEARSSDRARRHAFAALP